MQVAVGELVSTAKQHLQWAQAAEVVGHRAKVLCTVPMEKDGTLVIVGTIVGRAYCFNLNSMDIVWALNPRSTGALRALDVHSGIMLCGFDDCSLHVFVFANGDYSRAPELAYVVRNAHLDYIRCVKFSPQRDDAGVAAMKIPPFLSCADDQTVRLFEWLPNTSNDAVATAANQRQQYKPSQTAVLNGHAHYVMAVAWLPQQDFAVCVESQREGSLSHHSSARYAVSVGLDRCIFVWDTVLKSLVTVKREAHQKGINCVHAFAVKSAAAQESAVSPVSWIVATGGDDAAVVITHIEIGSSEKTTLMYPLRRIESHRNNVCMVMFLVGVTCCRNAASNIIELVSTGEDGLTCTHAVSFENNISSRKANGEAFISRQALQRFSVSEKEEEMKKNKSGRNWCLGFDSKSGELLVGWDGGVSIYAEQDTSSGTDGGVVSRGVVITRTPAFVISLPSGGELTRISDGGARIDWLQDRRRTTYIVLTCALIVQLITWVIFFQQIATYARTHATLGWDFLGAVAAPFLALAPQVAFLPFLVYDVPLEQHVTLQLKRGAQSIGNGNAADDVDDAEEGGRKMWKGVVHVEWTSLRSKVKRLPHEGCLHFTLNDSSAAFISMCRGVALRVPTASVNDQPAVDEDVHLFTPKHEGQMCGCGSHPLTAAYAVPFLNNSFLMLFSMSETHRICQEWTMLTTALSQQRNGAIFFSELESV